VATIRIHEQQRGLPGAGRDLIIRQDMATIRIPRLVGKTNKSGLTSWFWQPSATLRKKGWSPRPLGSGGSLEDIPADVAEAARKLNQDVDGSAELRPVELRRIQRPLTLDQAIARWRDAGFASVKRPGRRSSRRPRASTARSAARSRRGARASR
jgi:hypothetical protein